MRILLAGATGVIGMRLLRLMVADGHEVAGITRTAGKLEVIRSMGATPIHCDVFDRVGLTSAARAWEPEVVMHQLTDLPDELAKLTEFLGRNERIRGEGTRNLLQAAEAAGASHIVAQSIAWPAGPAVETHEQMVLDAGGAVLRYGQFYGPGTYYEVDPPNDPKVHIDVAARETMRFLAGPAGVFTIVDPQGAPR
jgi:UDP-glucose 4-epimerase